MVSARLMAVLCVALICAGVSGWAQTTAADTEDTILRACLPRNAGVLAGRRLTGGSGFDFRVAQEVAQAMGRTLEPVWFENDLDEESNPLSETYAMLGYGLCDIVPGHPRYVAAIGTHDQPQATLPRWLGMPNEISRETGMLAERLVGYVDVAPIAVSEGYMRTQVGIVYQDGMDMPQGPNDLSGRRMALQENTLSGTIAMLNNRPGDRGDLVTMNPGAGFLWEVEKAGHELAIVDVIDFDTFKKTNPFTTLRLADWRHPVGMDLGVAVLAGNKDLLNSLNAALQDIVASGRALELAVEEGLTYAPPSGGGLSQGITMQMLVQDP
jgi:ABC-type amino acid transport substrate-binding protein